MNFLLRFLYALVMFFILVTYNIVSSTILIFTPRVLRRKKNIKGQRVLITGAGSGVGRELAIEFSKHGVCLILVDINRQSLLQTEKLLDRCSPVFIYDCDVSDYKKVYEMAKTVQKDAGDVDILVNNAGIVSGKFLWDLPEEKIVKTMEVNALAHFWVSSIFSNNVKSVFQFSNIYEIIFIPLSNDPSGIDRSVVITLNILEIRTE